MWETDHFALTWSVWRVLVLTYAYSFTVLLPSHSHLGAIALAPFSSMSQTDVWRNPNLHGAIISYFNIIDLDQYRRCAKCTAQFVKRYLQGECGQGGFAGRYWEFLSRHYPNDLVERLRQFLKDTNACFTGSSALKVLTGDYSWDCRDIDVIAALNANTIKGLVTLIEHLASTPSGAPISEKDRSDAFTAVPCFLSCASKYVLSALMYLIRTVL
jgi:hypothetical protein